MILIKSIINLNYLIKLTVKYHYLKKLIICIITLVVLINVSALETSNLAMFCQTRLVIVGFFFLIPVPEPEYGGVFEIVYGKPISLMHQYFIRIITAIVLVLGIILIITGFLYFCNGDFQYWKYTLETFLTALFLGAAGMGTAFVTKSVITGYLVSASIYCFEMLFGEKYVNQFYIFTLLNTNADVGRLLAGCVLLLIFILIYNILKYRNIEM